MIIAALMAAAAFATGARHLSFSTDYRIYFGKGNPQLAAEAARELAQRVQAAHPDLELHVTGAMMLNNAFSEAAIADLKTLIPAMYAMIILVMWLMLRSVAGTLSTLVIIGVSAASAMGLAGTLGFSLTPPTAQATTPGTTACRRAASWPPSTCSSTNCPCPTAWT